MLDFAVYFLPRRTIVCEKVFQEEGISANVTFGEFPLDFIPFDYDVLSLELDSAFKASTTDQSSLSDHDSSSTITKKNSVGETQSHD